MKSTIICGGNILIVGDGDFSFTVSLVKHSDVVPGQVFTSNLETETSILHHAQASDNMRSLKALGVSVFLETDATDLHNHPLISKESFERVIFNFPLADRHNIKKNRSLLADFFSSCRSILAPGGCVLVTLCKGQGGTPADQPIRSWHDSWQVVAMATNASFLLREVLPFDPADFPEYHSVGFRFQDKSFNVTGALTHVFEEGTLVEDGDVRIRGVVHRDGISYSCSSYVASHLKRNLLEEPRNPLCILKRNLEERFKNNSTTCESTCSPIIPSHKSMAYICNEDAELVDSSLTDDSTCPPEMMSEKARKNNENLKRMAKTQLAHGVMSGVSEMKAEGSICSGNDGSCFLPDNKDNVYILVKSKDSVETTKPGRSEEEMKFDCSEKAESNSAPNPYDSPRDCSDLENKNEGDGFQMCSQASLMSCAGDATESSSSIYHCRTSLLENLPYLCRVITDNSGIMKGSNSNESGSMLKAVDVENVPKSELGRHVSGFQNPHPQQISFPCILTSGQCMRPCHTLHNSSPMKHEMLILHKIDNTQTSSAQSTTQVKNSASAELNKSHFDLISSKVISLLQPLHASLPGSLSLAKMPQDSPSFCVKIEGINDPTVVGQIYLTNSVNESDTVPNDNIYSYSDVVGFVLYAELEHCSFHVTVIDLQAIVCRLCKIDDWRLLWSVNDKFLKQFQSTTTTTEFSLCQFHPFSLYPMKFVHDLSFWEQKQKIGEESVSTFDIYALYEAIRTIAGDLVINVSLIDVYEDPETKQRSRCYRLHFLSSDKCLPYVTSWKIQSKIRMEVARSLGVQLR